MLGETLRSRWFSACLHAGSWLLLILVVTGIGGKHPRFREARPDPTAVTMPVPVAKLEGLFVAVTSGKPAVVEGGLNPFTTTYFQPQTAATPVPTTRTISLTYQGYFQTGNGPQRALIRFGDSLISLPVGNSVATNLVIANVTALTLTLTNPVVGQTNVLTLNTKKEIEIPIK